MSTSNRRLFADWADISLDILDKIQGNLASKESDKNVQEFVKSARLVNKHWRFWANGAAQSITMPTCSRLSSFGKLCFGSIQYCRGVRSRQAKWMRSGGDVARHERGTFFASLGTIDMLKTVALKFSGVEKLSMPHQLPNPHLAIPFLHNMGRLRNVVMKSGDTSDVNLSWLSSVEGLRCLCIVPRRNGSTKLYPYSTIGTLSQLESLELKIVAPINILVGMRWLGGMQCLKRLQLSAHCHTNEHGLKHSISLMTALADLHLGRFKLTKAILVELRGLELLQSITFVYCSLEPIDALTCLNSLPSLSTFAIRGDLIALHYECLGTLTSLRTLSVENVWERSNFAYRGWMAALTCLTRLELYVAKMVPDFTHWAGLPDLKHLGLKTMMPLASEQREILKSLFPAAELVVGRW